MRDRRGLCGRMIVGDGRRARLFLILGRRMAFKSTVCSGRIWDWPTNHALNFYSWSELEGPVKWTFVVGFLYLSQLFSQLPRSSVRDGHK